MVGTLVESRVQDQTMDPFCEYALHKEKGGIVMAIGGCTIIFGEVATEVVFDQITKRASHLHSSENVSA